MWGLAAGVVEREGVRWQYIGVVFLRGCGVVV